MIKVIFFDVDGTLLSHSTKGVPQSARDTIKKLRKANVKCVICTGRHMIELNDLPMDNLDLDGYILLNGQLLLDGNKKMIHGSMMSDYQKIIDLFNEKELPVQILEEDDTYINFVNDYVVNALTDISTPVVPIKAYSGKPFYQAVCFIDESKQNYLEDKLRNCKITRWNNKAVDVVSKDGGKVAGIKKYLELTNITQDETMAFGDGENDIEMLEFVKYGIALGNGVDKLKEVADYITTDIDDDGIKNAVEKYKDIIFD